MSKKSSPIHQAPLPESLRKQLIEFQQELRKIKITEAVLAGIAGLLFSYLLVFLLDRFFATPQLVRLLILLGGTSLCAFFAPLWIHKWVFRHRREEQLARLISRRFPKLGDRLLGVIELQDQTELREALSPELRAAAMEHVARQAAGRKMEDALPPSRHRKIALGLGLGFAILIATLIFAPGAGLNPLKRWLLPLSDTERYTFTQLDLSGLPNPYPVPYGEPFDISIPLKENSDQRPGEATARYGAQDWISTNLGENGSYRFEIPPQQAKDTLTLRAGDAIHYIPIEPLIRPELESLVATVNLPDYLELPPLKLEARSGVLSAVEGSTLTLQGEISRDLSSATLKSAPIIPPAPVAPPVDPLFGELAPAKPLEPTKKPTLPDARNEKLATSGRSFTSSALTVTSFSEDIPLTWKDIHGLEASSPFNLRLDSVADQPPVAYTQGIERQLTMLPEKTLNFQILAEDDFGLREVGIEWQGEFTKPTDGQPANGELPITIGGPDQSRLTGEVDFSPQTHGIIPQKLSIRAYTQDYKPDRQRVYSEPIIVYVLTRDEHAQLLKNRADRIIGELEDAIRREQNNLDNNKRLDNENTPEELQEQEARDKLAEQEAAEKENAEKMKELAEKMQELFEEALSNGEIDKETMKKMAESMESMKELGEKDLPEIAGELNEAQDRKSTAEKAKKDLKEAIEKQEKALEKMKETAAKANEANEEMEGATFINRLNKAAGEQDGIAAAFIAELTKPIGENSPLVGATPETPQLDPVHARLLNQLTTQQDRTAGDVRWIQEDLGHFYSRTRKEIHKELMEAMRASNIDPALARLKERIADNNSFQSTLASQQWAEQLREWAKKLEGENDDGGGGGGGGGGGSPEDQDFEFMLKVMKMVQQEQDIRARTRSLEQIRRSLDLKNPSTE